MNDTTNTSILIKILTETAKSLPITETHTTLEGTASEVDSALVDLWCIILIILFYHQYLLYLKIYYKIDVKDSVNR